MRIVSSVLACLFVLLALMVGRTYALWTEVGTWWGIPLVTILADVLFLFSLGIGLELYEKFKSKEWKEHKEHCDGLLWCTTLLLAPILLNCASGLAAYLGFSSLADVLFYGRFWIPWGGIVLLVILQAMYEKITKLMLEDSGHVPHSTD